MASGRFGLIPRIKIVVWIAAFAPLLILIDRILLGGAYIGCLLYTSDAADE